MNTNLLLEHIAQARRLIPDSTAYLITEDVLSAAKAQMELLQAQAIILAYEKALISEPPLGEREQYSNESAATMDYLRIKAINEGRTE